MNGQRLPLWATIAGIAVGLGLAVSLVAFGVLTIPVKRDLQDASADFLKAWERSRLGTFVVDSDFRRKLGDGRTLYSQSQLVQRPPDRIIRQFGGIQGTISGHLVVCSTDQGGHFSCFAGNTATPDYGETVRHELDIFRSYFRSPSTPGSSVPAAPSPTTDQPGASGPGSNVPDTSVPDTSVQESSVPGSPAGPGLYRVGYAPEPGCFEFFQLARYPDAPYGTYAKFCFDATTGAMRSIERHLARDVVETVTAVTIVPSVSPSDFDTTQNRDFDQRMDLGDFADPVIPPDTAAPGTVPPAAGNEFENLSNADLISAGSAVAGDRVAVDSYVTEAVRRMSAGTLSINDEAWVDQGQPRPLLSPVVFRLLGLGIFLPGPPA